MRDTARTTTTNQPTNRAPHEPAMERNSKFGPNLVVFGQKILVITGEIKRLVTNITENPPRHLVCICFWSGMGQNGQKCQYLAQNDQKCIFWTKFGSFWAKIPIVLWSCIRSNGPKMLIFGRKCQFWAKFGCFWAKNPFFWGEGVKLLVPSY